MKILVTILVGTMLIGCKTKNIDFDPFDNDYRFHKNFRLSDYDTIRIECGYWNLTNKHNGSYYQFFLDESEIVGKGFNLTLDEIQVSYPDYDSINSIFKSMQKKLIDITSIQERLKQFGIKQVTLLPDSVLFDRLEMIDERDSVFYANILSQVENNKIIRQISYFK